MPLPHRLPDRHAELVADLRALEEHLSAALHIADGAGEALLGALINDAYQAVVDRTVALGEERDRDGEPGIA
jgi:hypothetical protein